MAHWNWILYSYCQVISQVLSFTSFLSLFNVASSGESLESAHGLHMGWTALD